MTLADVLPGRPAVVESIDGPLATRLLEIGLAPGSAVEVVQRVALGGPVIVDLRGFVFGVRRGDAAAVRVREGAP